MVVRLSDRVEIDWFKQVGPTAWPGQNEIAVSGIGTIAAARVRPKDDSIEPFIAVSMYGRWFSPHPSVGAIVDLCRRLRAPHHFRHFGTFIGSDKSAETHRIVAAGDLNLTYGYGHGDGPYWDARYRNLFERMDAIGLEFMGPQRPNGRQAEVASDG